MDDFARRSGGVIWFRGHHDSSAQLKAGLFRRAGLTLKDYLTVEEQLYRNYKNLGCLLHHNASGWPLLYSMQHHGVKTRLLDWTESFANALYFATWGWFQGNACIWLLDPLQLNRLSAGKGEILSPEEASMPYCQLVRTEKFSHSLAVYPSKNTKRISIQHGVFTVQGNSLQSLAEEFDGRLLKDGYLVKLELTPELRDDVERFLFQNGIHHFTLFPDLDGLAHYLNELFIG